VGDDVSAHQHPVEPARVALARAALPSGKAAVEITARLSLVAEVTRLLILLALRAAGELCVGDLALAVQLTDDAVGYALRMLRTAGLVVFRKEGRVVYYRLAEGFPAPLLDYCVPMLVRLVRSNDEDGTR